jgi:transcriptional regulator with XRE-family HTH domain
MIIGDRLRELRQHKNLSQGEVQQRAGLISAYISRIENGHTVPSLETLEKFARALEVPLYHLFYDGENPPKPFELPNGSPQRKLAWGASGKQFRMLLKLRRALGKMDERNRKLLLILAKKMAAHSGKTCVRRDEPKLFSNGSDSVRFKGRMERPGKLVHGCMAQPR